MPSQPTAKPAWTQGNPGVQDQPTAGEKFGGFAPDERPPAEWVNWILGNISDWIDWLDYITGVKYAQGEFDAVVGVGGTHADINTLMADVNIAQKFKVLVVGPMTLTSDQIITKSDIEFVFKPNAVWTKGVGATIAITVNADRVTIRNGRFVGFSTGGDIGIRVAAGKKNNIITNNKFNSCDTDIDDLGTNTLQVANLVEV